MSTTLDVRLRLSLGWRMVVALAVLAALSAVVALTAVVVSGLVVWVGLLLIALPLELSLLPLLGQQSVLIGGLLANPVLIVVVSGLCLLPVLYARPVRDEVRAFRTELRTEGTLAEDRHPEVATMARRLAQQADVPDPDVSIANRRRPESYALGGRANGTIVITRGLIRQLTDEQLEAVLAHEISHLANGDSRIMNLALIPMLVAEHVGSDERPDWLGSGLLLPLAYLAHLTLWALVTSITRVQQLCCRLGITFLSRGREFAADRSAATLTGSPSALASALQTLDDERGTPGQDKRTWTETASALDILPREESMRPGGVLGTHPSTDKRIHHLEQLTDEMTTERR